MSETPSRNPLGRLFRFILFVLSAGYLYPHVLTEGMDMKKYQEDVNRQIQNNS